MKLRLVLCLVLAGVIVVIANAKECDTNCYSDFTKLKNDIESVGDKQLGIFTLCPNTVLSADGSSTLGIQLKGSGSTYKIQCGSSGERRNNCVIEGGARHFSPGNNALKDTNKLVSVELEISGVTFRGATDTSFYAQATSSGDYTFYDCLWEENTSSKSNAAGAVHFAKHIVGNDISFTNCYFVVSFILSFGFFSSYLKVGVELKKEVTFILLFVFPNRETRVTLVQSITPEIHGEVKISILIDVCF